MIKNLIYGALGVGGTIAVTAIVVSTGKPEQSHTITFNANGGYFMDSQATSVTKDVEKYNLSDCISNVYNTVHVAWDNHDLLGWTTNKEEDALVDGGTLIANYDRSTLFAKWKPSDIQKHEITNYNGTSIFEGVVEKFPVAFYGTAVSKVDGVVRFKVPVSSGLYRVSLDPQTGGWSRVCAKITIIQTDCDAPSTNQFDMGTVVSTWYSPWDTIPVNVRPTNIYFYRGASCEIRVEFIEKDWTKDEPKQKYVLGIGLGDRQVKFIAGNYGYTYSETYDDQFKTLGANLTTNLPFGFLPDVENTILAATFRGWFTAERGGEQLTKDTIVGTNDVYYAQWDVKYTYTVKFQPNGAGVKGEMNPQDFESNEEKALSYNRYYFPRHKFLGWARSAENADKGLVEYSDGQVVKNLTDKEETIPLYAVWEYTPNENYFTVSSGITNFTDVAVSTNITTSVAVPGSIPSFIMTTTSDTTNGLRVSLDPANGSLRSGAVLHVDRLFSGMWSNDVCKVSDLSTNAVYYSFANADYRFRITGVNASSSYSVGLGAKEARIDFDPCGKDYVNASAVSSSLTFDWTVDTPFGYLPKLTSAQYGTFLGWYKTNDVIITNNEVTVTNVVVGAEKVYAHWANQPYYVAFNGSGATMPTKSYVQNFYYNKAQALSRNQYYYPGHKFDGWRDDKGRSYADGAVVSNLCSIAGATNTLYAVWQDTPGTNWYYVAGGMTNFGTIAVSQGSPTLFVGRGDTTQFYIASASSNNCRVAIDPDLGYGRTGVKLTVSERQTATNKWESACEVTDLSEKEVKCSFKGGYQYKFDVSSSIGTNGYVVSVGAEGARYIFEACGGNFVGEKETTKVKFYNWTVGSTIAYTPPVTTNAYVRGINTWHYTPQYYMDQKIFSVTNLIVSGGEKLYTHWSDAAIVDLIFDWNLAEANVVFTNYYGQGATVYLYDDAYVRQPIYDNMGFLGWTTNRTGIAGYDLTSFTATTNSTKFYYAQWTDEWKSSRTSDGAGLSIDGYYGTLGAALNIPTRIHAVSGIEWPVNVVAIGDSAFENCSFTALSLPETLTSIGSAAFSGCSAFKVLNIPEGVTCLGDSAFDGCTSLTTVTFPTVEVENEYAESGFLDGVFDPDSPSVELGTCLFKGCTSLKDVELPLGVNCIPDECFSGCTAMTTFDKMPYTVTQIGEEAFAGCTHLVTNVMAEVVDEIGPGAFKKCARLRIVKFLGDQPVGVYGDIFKGTQRNVLVAYLQNMCQTAKDYCGGLWPALPGTWPDGSDYARTLTWLVGKYPRRKVIFNYNDNVVLWKSTQMPALYHSGRVFGLLAPTKEEMDAGSNVTTSDDEEGEEEETEEKSGFSGWYTQPMGGRKIGNYWVVPTASEGDSAPITVYAHWGEEKEAGETEVGSRSSEEYPVSWPGAEGSENTFEDFTGFYSADDDMFYYSASTFNGIVVDTGADNSAITGTVVFAFQDATYPADGGMQSAFTATITWNGGRTTSISGVADAEGYLRASGNRWSFGEGEEGGTLITKSGIYGWLTDNDEGITFRVYAARNRYAMSNEASKSVVLTGLQATKGTWHVVLKSSAGESEFSNGYSTFAITISGMGQAAIEGTLADGTKVSTSSTLIIGDGCCCLPVSIRPYGGKGGVSFMLWFAWQPDGGFSEEEDDVSVQGLSAWTAPTFTVPITDIEIYPLTFIDAKRYEGDASFECDRIAPVKITAYDKGTKWKIATGEENPDNLKVSYNAATGLFTGSFAVENSETGKMSTATVNGAFTDSITSEGDIYHGYGTAVIKDEGSVPVEIETEALP